MEFREARRFDLGAIVELLADDDLGSGRESTAGELPHSYVKAFEEIAADPNNELVVVCSGDEIVGTLQLTFIPNLTFQGGRRAQIEGVRVKDAAWGIYRSRCHEESGSSSVIPLSPTWQNRSENRILTVALRPTHGKCSLP